MNIELYTSLIAIIVSIAGVVFNYYKIIDERRRWKKEQYLTLEKEHNFYIFKKRCQNYTKIFKLLGEVRDIDYPPEHYEALQKNKTPLITIADKILLELYSDAGLFMTYETRSLLLKVYQLTYRFYNNEIDLDELVDIYYKARRSIRNDLEIDDAYKAKTSQNLYENIIENGKNEELNKTKWCIENKIACSPRPGYPYKNVPYSVVTEKILEWKNEYKIETIICLLSEQEIKEYYDIDLISEYNKYFDVYSFDIPDFSKPVISKDKLKQILKAYKDSKKPILIHCGAGIDRTKNAYEYIKNNLM